MSYYNLPKFRAFRFWCQKVLPLVYDDSLSYYEVLSKVVHGLNLQADVINEIEDILEGSGIDIDEAVEKVIDKLEEDGVIETEVANAIAQAISDGDIDERCEYVVNQMITNGDLDTYVNGLITAETSTMVKTYDLFEDIPTSGLTVGSRVRTKGFYSRNDGGEALYAVASEDVYSLANAHYTFRILDGVTPKKAGARANGTDDDTAILNGILKDYRIIDMGDTSCNYLVSDSLVVRTGRQLIGHGCKITRADLTNVPIITGVVGQASGNIKISGIEFIGGTQSVLTELINFYNSQYLMITDCSFRDSCGYSIKTNLCNNAYYSNLRFFDALGGQGNPGGSFYIHGGFNIHIDDCYGYNLQDHLVYLDGSGEGSNVHNITISGCITRLTNIEGSLTSAASIVAYGNCKRIAIVNCNFYTPKQGICIADRDGDIPVGVSITGCNFFNSSDNCVQVLDNSGVTHDFLQCISIVGCQFVDCGQDCVDIRTGNGVNISGCNMAGATRYGVSMSSAKNVVVSNNNIGDCAEAVLIGRNAEDCDNIVIANNNIGDCTVYGIYVGKGSNIKLTGNIFYGTFGTKQIYCNAVTVTDLQGLVDGTARSVFWSNAIPSAGKFATGDICLDSTGATLGWHCTAGGNPGTWAAITA